MTLGRAIRAAREGAEPKLTLRDVAFALGEIDPRLARTEPTRVGEWERDKSPRLSFITVVAVADALGVPVERLADAVRAEREAIRAERDRAAREAWERGRDVAEEELEEDDGEEEQRGTDGTTR